MPQTRTFYIAAEETNWDYLRPADSDEDIQIDIPEAAKPYLEPSSTRIGSKYLKARYRQYTSKNFDTPLQTDPVLGILGPTIYAQVGDTIKVYFKNNLALPTNMHPHGLESPARFQSPFDDFLVSPGEVRVYFWQVTEEAGPQGIYDGAVAWLYYPDLTSPVNWHAGLVGMIVVTSLNAASKPIDIQSSYPLLFAVFDENLSPFLDQSGEATLGVGWSENLRNDTGFDESNRMASINGYAFSTMSQFSHFGVSNGKTTQFYLGTLSSGTPQEKIVAHFHGHSLSFLGHRRTALKLTPGSVFVTELYAQKTGDWLIRTTSNDLNNRGMVALYSVK